jgi:hypothetical protein
LHIATVWFARNLPIDHLLVKTWPLIALPALFYLLQTSLTTCLIVWRIYCQLRLTTNTRMVSMHVPPLLSIVKIIAESAMIYTAGMLVLIVLFALDHPARIVVYSCMIPITGESYKAFFLPTLVETLNLLVTALRRNCVYAHGASSPCCTRRVEVYASFSISYAKLAYRRTKALVSGRRRSAY